MRFHINILTIDRAERGGRNYITGTLESIFKSESGKQKAEMEPAGPEAGAPQSAIRNPQSSIHVWDSGSVDMAFLANAFYTPGVAVHPTGKRLNQNQNLCRALRAGAVEHPDYVVICEDDIIVCADWLGRMDRWLGEFFEQSDCRLASFYTPYDEVKRTWETAQRLGRKMGAWRYPVDLFYGMCCIAMRPDVALGMADAVERGAESANEADLWLKKYFRKDECFLASAPCLVQHVGDDSYIQGPGATKRRCSAFAGE